MSRYSHRHTDKGFLPSFTFLKNLYKYEAPVKAIEKFYEDRPWTDSQKMGLAIEHGLVGFGDGKWHLWDKPDSEKDYRTKVNREARDENDKIAKGKGMIACERSDFNHYLAIGGRVRSMIERDKYLDDTFKSCLFNGIHDEFVKNEEVGLCGHPDKYDENMVIDIKTTTMAGHDFRKQIMSNYYDVQLCIYMEILGLDHGVILAIEIDEPHLYALHHLNRGDDQFASARKLLDRWLENYRTIRDTGAWSEGYMALKMFGYEFPTRYVD